MIYKDKFEKEVVQNTALKSNLSEEHVYIIYKITFVTLYRLMVNPFTERICLPVMGKFCLNMARCRRMEDKIYHDINQKSKVADRVLRANFNLLANVKFFINKYGKR